MSHLKVRSIRALALLLSTCAMTTTAAASSITITTDLRQVAGHANVGSTTDAYFVSSPPTPSAIADAAATLTAGGTAHSNAALTSNVDTPTLGAIGTLDVTGAASTDPVFADAQVDYYVRFDLMEASTYSWNASLDLAFDPGQLVPADWRAQGTAFLYDLDSSTFLQYVDAFADASHPVLANASSGTGVLLPGSYWFFGQVYSSGSAAAGLSFSGTAGFETALTLTPINSTAVPEPGTLMLVGGGAAAAALRRRRRRASAYSCRSATAGSIGHQQRLNHQLLDES
jgi:hypothetical protein